MPGIATEVWFRNPANYIRELVEVQTGLVAWDRGFLFKKKIDPAKHAELYFGQAINFRVLVIGDQGTAELRPGFKLDKPVAVYPTWCYGDEIALLEELITHPIGEDINACSDPTVPRDERPVFGQEHRVVISDLPSAKTAPGRSMLRTLRELQEDYPSCIIHVHGLYGFNPMFGFGFRSVDYEPRQLAQKGKVVLPSGKEMKFENTLIVPQWVNLLGYKPVDLKIPRNRCMYNIRSAQWAGEHFRENHKFKVQGKVDPQPEAIEFAPPTTKLPMTTNAVAKPGDKVNCATCSLAGTCKFYREESVCSLPFTEANSLAKVFGTRDTESIKKGLGDLLEIQGHRLQRGLEVEEEYGELDPEVTKIIGQLFANGVKLAKLQDPALSGPKFAVNIHGGKGGTQQIVATNPAQLVGTIVAQYEKQGIKREDITPKMIEAAMSTDTTTDSRVIDIQAEEAASG